MLVFGLLLMSSVVFAEDANLYRGDVPISSREQAAVNEAVASALAQVLVRISGDNQVPLSSAGQALLQQANRYMLSYTFLDADPIQLAVQFDETRLRQALQSAGLPLWGANRPQTVHWLTSDTGGVIQTDSSPLADTIHHQAQLRGLPHLLPLYDLEDSMRVSATDISGNFSLPVIAASERYDASFVLLTSILPVGSQWRYQYYLYRAIYEDNAPKVVASGNGLADSEAIAVAEVLDQIGQFYGQRYAAVLSAEPDTLQLQIGIPGGFFQLMQLERYLGGLSAVESIQIHAVQNNVVTMELQLLSEATELERAFRLEPRLSKLPPTDDIAADYQWDDR